MSREERVKILLAPTLGPLRAVFDLLRTLPWPRPLQRITQRGLERLTARIPELAELLGGVRRGPARRPERPVSSSLSQLFLLLASRDYRTRVKAVQALANHSDPQAIEALVASLRDRSVEVAVEAARALALIGGPTAREALLAALVNADGYYHSLSRAAAVHGLGTLLGTRSDVSTSTLGTRSDVSASTVGTGSEPNASTTLTSAERAPLEAALRDLDAEVSIAAISALIASAGTEAGAPLMRVIENADGFYLPVTRLAAARGLERLASPPAAELERLRRREIDGPVIEALDRLLAQARAMPQA